MQAGRLDSDAGSTPSAFFEDFGQAARSVDMTALGTVYQSLFAMSGGSLHGGITTASRHNSTDTDPKDDVNSTGDVAMTGMLSLPLTDDTEERPFPCPFCEARFKKKQHLQNHERIHTGEKYVCSICSQGFSRRHILKHHIYRKHLLGSSGTTTVGGTVSNLDSLANSGSVPTTPLSPPPHSIFPLLQSGMQPRPATTSDTKDPVTDSLASMLSNALVQAAAPQQN